MVFAMCRALPTRPKARPEGCTVHDPEEPNRRWAVVTRIQTGRLTHPMQCSGKALHGRLTCYAHRKREAEARALKDASNEKSTDDVEVVS